MLYELIYSDKHFSLVRLDSSSAIFHFTKQICFCLPFEQEQAQNRLVYALLSSESQSVDIINIDRDDSNKLEQISIHNTHGKNSIYSACNNTYSNILFAFNIKDYPQLKNIAEALKKDLSSRGNTFLNRVKNNLITEQEIREYLIFLSYADMFSIIQNNHMNKHRSFLSIFIDELYSYTKDRNLARLIVSYEGALPETLRYIYFNFDKNSQYGAPSIAGRMLGAISIKELIIRHKNCPVECKKNYYNKQEVTCRQ